MSGALPDWVFQRTYRLICDCSDDSVYDLINGKIITNHSLKEAIIRKNSVDGEIIEFKPYNELTQENKEIIDWCVDFLACKKYKTYLLDFIHDYLGIGIGLDYLLLNLLRWYDFTDHGSSIASSWLTVSKECSDERREIIKNWASNYYSTN